MEIWGQKALEYDRRYLYATAKIDELESAYFELKYNYGNGDMKTIKWPDNISWSKDHNKWHELDQLFMEKL